MKSVLVKPRLHYALVVYPSDLCGLGSISQRLIRRERFISVIYQDSSSYSN
jgi:hypothetical protein